MACLMNCVICGTGTCDCRTCSECEAETTRRVLAREPTDTESIAKSVQENRMIRQKQEIQEQMESISDQMGRSNWRQHRDRADKLQKTVIKLSKELHWALHQLRNVGITEEMEERYEIAEKILQKGIQS